MKISARGGRLGNGFRRGLERRCKYELPIGVLRLAFELPVFRNAINCSVLVVRPAEPFIRWAASVGGESVKHTREALAEDHTAYLIPRQDSLEVDEAVLEAIYAEIFERELLSWHLDKARWPAPRTLALFKQWFELTLCGLVVDLWEAPLERDAD